MYLFFKIKISQLVARGFFILCGFLGNVIGAQAHVLPITEKNSLIRAIEGYFHQIRSLESPFVQVDKNGQRTGTFYLQRPDKFAFEYSDRDKVKIFSNGNHLVIIDPQIDYPEHIPLDYLPTAFLFTQQDLKLLNHPEVNVLNLQKEKGKISLTLQKKGEENLGTITLHFTTTPQLKLAGWNIIEPTGAKVLVQLRNVRHNVAINPEHFRKPRQE